MVFDRLEPEDPVDEFVAVDLADSEATARALEQVLAGRTITRLVNNVGAVRPALLEDAELDDFDYLMALNVRSAIQCTKALAPGMRAAGFGRIVNVSSRSVRGKELRTNYAATKAALIGLTRTWALELGDDGITVNCICPGPTATELYVEANPPDSPRTKAALAAIPAGRIGTPDDMAPRHRLLPRRAQRLRNRAGDHGLRRLQPRRPRELRAELDSLTRGSGSGGFVDGDGHALPQPAQSTVDRCSLGAVVRIQHAAHFALGNVEIARKTAL